MRAMITTHIKLSLKYCIAKDITGSRAETIIPVTTGKSSSLASAYPIQTRALETKSNKIIKDFIKNFNTKPQNT